MASKLDRFASRSLTPQPGEQPSNPKKKEEGKIEGVGFKGKEVISNPRAQHKPASSWSGLSSPISWLMRAKSAPLKERLLGEGQRPEGYGEQPVDDDNDLDVTSEGEPNLSRGRKPSPSAAVKKRPEFDEGKSPLRHSVAPSFEMEEEGRPAPVSPKKEVNQINCEGLLRELRKFFCEIDKEDRQLAVEMLLEGASAESYDWVGEDGLRVYQFYMRQSELKQRERIIEKLKNCGLMNSKMELIQKSEISKILSERFKNHIKVKK